MGHSYRLSTSEWALSAALGEGAATGFELAALFTRGGKLEHVCAVQRPQLYRALERLEAITQGRTGKRGLVYALTKTGEKTLRAWFMKPVSGLLDIKKELLLKLLFLERRQAGPEPLINDQVQTLNGIEQSLEKRLKGLQG